MGYGNTNSPGGAATADHNGLMSAEDKRTLETLKNLVSFTLMERTASGDPATFDDGAAANLKAISVTITPTQSGSGDPSPTNIRPISGVSSVTVTRTGENGANSQSVTVSLVDGNNQTLTVYGGTLDVTTGALTVTQALYTVTGTETFITYLTSALFHLPHEFARRGNRLIGVCSHAPTAGGIISPDTTILVAAQSSPADAGYYSQVQIYGLTDYWGLTNATYCADEVTLTPQSVQSFFAGLYQNGTPVQICYQLRTPVTYTLTPAQLAALAGYNAVSSDAGAVSVKYRADASLAYEELMNAILSAGAGI